MAISVSYTDLFSNDYSSRIQDALGNSGATAAITTSNGGYNVSITGTPTGSGLKAEASEAQSSGSSQAASDTVTLSPAAQAKLEQQTVAVQLLSADRIAPSNTAAKLAVKSPQPALTSGQTNSNSTDVDDVTQLAQEDPTQVVKDIVSAAASDVAAISTTQGFYQAAAADPQFLTQFTSYFSSEDAAAVQNAFADGTLTVRPLTGSGETLTGSSMTLTSNPAEPSSGPPAGLANQAEVYFGVGGIALSWSTSNSDTASSG